MVRPAVGRGDDHTHSGYRDQVAALGQVAVCPRGGHLGNPEPGRQPDAARYRVAGLPCASADLSLQRRCHLPEARHTREVIKIIWHLASINASSAGYAARYVQAR
jgi:hypothetical protein